ncbi:MAG: protein kinase [Kiritimatiellae bacterium]|jgi:thiamine kinase-like enzyme|nr:protein kinase [Kiritimatiellia bacterium]MDD2347788.1 protein kinase [Kiritimatiellia bacterium]MDD3584040.1 protein kinase [Kiritimatiellia bacterium]HHU15885.1 protein kinase [Lentisphaerota bacterium]HON46687.1 protein kinase [Kiritimatiellia bacterium]
MMDDVHNDSNILTDPVASAACPKCGAMLGVKGLPPFSVVQCPTCQFEFQVPARFGTFMLLQLLGAGGMGGVYRARDEGLNREVAIKVMLKSLGDDPQFVETFQREAQAAARLNHRHIAQIYSFGQEKGQPYIAMELVSGGSLDKMMAEQGPLDPTVVIHVGAQIAEGLSMAADAGMVHGDVKPENILFDTDKNAKLVDFGLSAMQSGPGNEVWGTPYYIAPEKVRRQKSDYRSDIYSLGGTLYHAITGVPPFEGVDATAVVKARFEGPPKPMSEIRDGIPKEVEAIIARMLEVEPQTRFPTYGSLLGDMKRYLSKAGPVKMEKSSKRIVLKGKRGVTGKVSATGMLAATGSMTGNVDEVPADMTPVEAIEEVQETEEEAGKRGCRMMGLIIGGVVALVVVLGLIVFGVMKHSERKKANAEQAQLVATQDKARTSIATAVANAKVLVERMQGFVPEAMGYPKEAADEVVKALGEEARALMVPPEPDDSAIAVAADGGQAAVPADAIPLDPAQLAELTKLLPPEAAKMLEGLDKLPPDQVMAKLDEITKALPADQMASLTNKLATLMETMAEGMAKGIAEGMAAMLTNAPVQAAQPPAQPAAAETAQDDAHPVIAIVRGMYLDAYSIKSAAALAERKLQEIEQKAKEAEQFTQVTKQDTEAIANLNNELVRYINSLGNESAFTEAPRKVSQLRRTLESVKTEVASLIEIKRREAIEAEKQKQAEEEAEKKRQEKEAYEKKVAEERARVVEAEEASVEELRQLKFREVFRALRELKENLETPEAQDTASVAIDRVTRIKDFHEYLVSAVPGFKSARGWSVDSADARSLTVGGRKIPWVDVYKERLDIVGELINELAANPENTKKLSLRERTRVMTNAALCMNFFYKEFPSAKERAKTLATEAARLFDIDADIIKGLLPEFFE